jgi:exosortase O
MRGKQVKGGNATEVNLLARLSGGSTSGWPTAARAGINLIFLAVWVWLYWPVFQYLAVLFTREEFRTNQIVLAAVAGLLIYRARRTRPTLRLDTPPQLYLPGLALMLASSIAYLLVERFLDINTLSASLFTLASYGLLGLWLKPVRWREGFPAMLLVVGILPFGAHLETFVGYPLRVFTAGLVRSGLTSIGFHSVGVDTILVFESGISQVDIPCSGVKSLWTGALFLLGATWVENRPLSLRWLLVAAFTFLLLITANLLRVYILAFTGPALGLTTLASMLHIPLGVLGFAGACAAAVYMLSRLPANPARSTTEEHRELIRPGWLGPLLAAIALVMVFVYTPRSANASNQPSEPPQWNFSSDLSVQPAPLTAQGLAWIRQDGAENADRYSFKWQNDDPDLNGGMPVTGTFMLLTSQTWRGQHQPERCFQVFGLTIGETNTVLVSPDFPMRYLSLSAPGVIGQVSAVYWLQSASQTTEDYGQRIWADLAPQRERWVLVTVLFDNDYVSQLPELNLFLEALHGSVRSSLMKGSVP